MGLFVKNDYQEIISKPALLGDLASNVECKERDRRNDSGLFIPFGGVVVYDTTTDGIKPPAATGDTPVGVAILRSIYEDEEFDYGGGTVRQGYGDGVRVPILKKGDIYVYCETAFSPTDTVYFRHTANGAGTVLGDVRVDADSATCDAFTAASFVNKSATAGIAILSLNLNG